VQGWGFSPAKPKTEHNALGIGLLPKRIALVVMWAYEMKGEKWWWWWDAGAKGSRGGGGFAPERQIPSAHAQYRLATENSWRGV
jgi:hypothetical protein